MDVRYGFQQFPNRCFTCAGSDPQQVNIDAGDIPEDRLKRYHVYICSTCVVAMAKMLSPLVGKTLIDNPVLAELEEAVATSVEQSRRAQSAEAELDRKSVV